MKRALLAAGLMLLGHQLAAETSLSVGYFRVAQPEPATLSNLDAVPDDLGLAGAALGLADNRMTGKFLGQSFALRVLELDSEADLLAAASKALSTEKAIILDAPAHVALAIADLPEARDALLLNASDSGIALRDGDCRANLLHTMPSRAMLSDALAQFLVVRKWTKTAMIAGPRPGDQALATAFEASLEKYGLKPGKRADWSFDADMRRTAANEMPLFTQALGKYDVLLVADEANDFARYIAFNTWTPRPIAGSEGLRPVGWSRVVEQWGAAQLQSRFAEAAGRPMQTQDYAAWAAMRALGEAMTRTASNDVSVLRAYLLSEDFELAGFKGRPLSFRAWNGQLRQPIPLVHASALVAQAPLEGFLHQHNELDSLGLDRADSACTAFED